MTDAIKKMWKMWVDTRTAYLDERDDELAFHLQDRMDTIEECLNASGACINHEYVQLIIWK